MPLFSSQYVLKRSRRKSLQITIRNGQVQIRSPLHLSEQAIEAFVIEKSQWISEKLQEQQIKQNEQLTIRDNASFLWLGRTVTLRFKKATTSTVLERDTELIVQSRNPTDDNSRKTLSHWIKQEAKAFMEPQTYALAKQMGLDQTLQGVGFRKTRSKWGHCSSTGMIQYNWLIMLAPMEVIDYLIAHETCHLRHMNHSKAFWQLVESVCPDHKSKRKWLKENEHKLII